MDPARWQLVSEIAAETLTLSGAVRERALDEACGSDSQLRQEVEAVLEAAVAASGFMERPAIQDLSSERRIGQVVGSYRLLEVLGQGGAGTVYLGERSDDAYRGQVAVKLLRPGVATAEAVRRFRAERQILATLDHPHIARLVDGGTTDEGLPYLVMELIDGLPIDRFCSDRGLDVRQRVRLVLDICEAVAAAHQKLVVHRDLKPSNILVASDGTPRLLDFGIAKLLDPNLLPEGADETRTGHRLLSPNFASPEQVRGQQVTTASDVYALGVVLYLLVTGRVPRVFTSLSLEDVESTFVSTPVAPSLVAKGGSDAGSSAGEGAPGRPIKGSVSRDLDTIILKALETEPTDRYGTVTELADDLRRSLEGHPIRARRATVLDRGFKFVRRHVVGTVATVVIAALAVGFVTTTVVQSRRVARERDKALQVTDFLASLFREASPDNPRGRDATVVDVLDRGAERLRTEMAGAPEVRAGLLGTLGLVYNDLGQYDKAEALLVDSVAAFDALPGPVPTDLPVLLNQLAYLSAANGRIDDTERYAKRALELGRRLREPDDLQIEGSLVYLGNVAQARSDLESSERYYREALEMAERAHGPEHLDTALRRIDLARVIADRSRFGDAEALLGRVIAYHRAQSGMDHFLTLDALSAQARIDEIAGRLGKALAGYREVHDGQRAQLDPEHPTLGRSHRDLGRVHLARGELSAAARSLEEALRILRLKLDDHSSAVLGTLGSVAELRLARGDLAASRELMVQLIDGVRARLGESGWRFGSALQALALIDRRLGDAESADASVTIGLQAIETAVGPNHPRACGARVLRSMIHMLAGRFREAIGDLEVAINGWQAMGLGDSPRVAAVRCRLAWARLLDGDAPGCLAALDEGQPVLLAVWEDDPTPGVATRLAEAELVRGDALELSGDSDAAHRGWSEALRWAATVPEEDAGAELVEITAAAMDRLGRPAEAESVRDGLRSQGWKVFRFNELPAGR